MMNKITIVAHWLRRNSLLSIALGLVFLVPGQATEVGQLKWAFQTGGMIGSSPAIGADGTVYVGSYDNNLYALDGVTGTTKWTFATGFWVESSPAIGADGTVYIGSGNGNIYALDGETGAKKWSFVVTLGMPSLAIGADGTVCIGAGDGSVDALDGATGAWKWRFGSGMGGPSSLAIGADNTVYVGGGGDRIVCALDGATGAWKWGFGGRIGTPWSPAIGADGTVYIGGEGVLCAVDGATGAAKWGYNFGFMYSSPAIGADGTVYIGSAVGNVHALDGATGTSKWLFFTGSAVYSSPAISADGTVYIGSGDGRFYALDGATGTKKWSFSTAKRLRSSPAIGADGTVYIGSDDGKLYALQGSSGLANAPWPKFRQNVQNSGRLRLPSVPKVLRQPLRAVFNQGSTGKIAVKVTGDPTPTLSWFCNGLPITGATQASLTIPSATGAAEGLYELTARNSVGQVTSKPIVVLVSNVKPQRWMGLKWEGGTDRPVTLERTTELGAFTSWHSVSTYPSKGISQTFVEMDPTNATCFYRLNSTESPLLSGAGLVNGWLIAEPVGSRIRVEVASEVSGWTNWQVLTNLTLPASPYLFLDLESLAAPERVYRTTPVP